ncbi:MAG: DUF2784 family protein [Candidatus Sungiibacteriota bacterium]
MVWVVILILGCAVALWAKRWRPFQAVIVASTLVSWGLFRACPLTMLEENLMRWGGGSTAGLKRGFLAHYLAQWFGASPPAMVMGVGTALIAILTAILFTLWLAEKTLRPVFVRIKK